MQILTKKMLAYLILVILAYLPEIFITFPPFDDWMSNAKDIQLFTVSFNLFLIILGVLFFSTAIVCILSARSNLTMHKNGLILFAVISLILFIVTVMVFPLLQGSISVVFSERFIPALLSTMIGLLGAFLVSCFVQSNPDTTYKNQYMQKDAESENWERDFMLDTIRTMFIEPEEPEDIPFEI